MYTKFLEKSIHPLKLTYFDGRGRGELIRLIFHSQNKKFEDERLSFQQWGTRKPSMKYGQLPVLALENGIELNESMAIAKYLARKTKLCGNDEMEIYMVDRALDTMGDLFLKAVSIPFENDENKKEELLKDLKEKHIPQYFGNLIKYIEEGKGEFLAGSNITIADIQLCNMLDNFPETRPHYPELDNIYKKVMTAYPGMKKYVETRPQTPF